VTGPATRLACLCFAALALTSCAPAAPPELCLTQLDVGQGDSLLLEFPGGAVWLVDGGGFAGGDGVVGRRSVLPELRRRGIDRIDRLVISHADSDHYEGLFALPQVIKVSEVWMPTRSAGPRFRRLITLFRRAGSELVVLDESPASFLGPAPVEALLLHPTTAWRNASGEAAGKNNNSIVFGLSLGQVDFLLTGDLEAAGEQWLLDRGSLRDYEVLKLGHHGSRSSSSGPFLDAVRPLVSLAGTGRDNRYGFPHASVRRGVLTRGSSLLWSGRHGTVRVCTDGWSLRAEQLVDGRTRAQLGHWSPQQLLDRNAELAQLKGATPGAPSRGISGSRGKMLATPKSQISRGRSARRGLRGGPSSGRRSTKGPKRSRRSKGGASSSQDQTATSSSTPLIDERTWERRRKARNRFRPGW
jgi:beta-lactamase superfamily II metal-dependent hydrolase